MARTVKPRGRPVTDQTAVSRAAMPDPRLDRYAGKRDFKATPEPGGGGGVAGGDRFVVQKHNARRLHFDLRLELDGVLKSWAITKGPSLDPDEKRLAVHTEDHPLEYLTFEGVIPKGEYGGGSMIVWDRGSWRPVFDPHKGYAKGHLEVVLEGERLGGRWHLVRMKPRGRETKQMWLLIKAEDEWARRGSDAEVALRHETSVISGRGNGDLEKAGTVRADHANRKAIAASNARPEPAKIVGARKGLLPVFLEPSLATPAETPPTGPDWIHEIKFDGYRIQARVDGGKVKMLTRSGLDWTDRFAAVADAVKGLQLDSALMDGEVVVEDEAGVSDFSALQADLAAGRTDRMVYHVFDLLYLSGSDLTRASLIDRKSALAGLVRDGPSSSPVVRYSDHIENDGDSVFRHACRLGLEGIVSKRRGAPYRTGRSPSWLKVKCTNRQEFVVAGFTRSSVSSKAVGSLVLGLYEKGDLIHVGRVGTGFTEATARTLFDQLDKMRQLSPPFPDKLPGVVTRGVVWIEPRLVAEVETRGWTADGLLRHASYKGLRDDKTAKDVVREGTDHAMRVAMSTPSRVSLTHPDRVLWPDVGLTKQGLADFYSDIATWILPHVTGRPLALVRCPTGIGKNCFFQKHPFMGMDERVRRLTISDEEALYIEDLDGLLALVQSSALEIHPWGSTVADLERPDRIVLDLDPDEGLDRERLVEGVLSVKERLDALGLASFLKTTGGKGFHVVVPLKPKAGWDEVKEFARGIAKDLARDAPGRFTDTAAIQARKGKIYLDYLRNGRGATAIAAFSTRARARAAVSTPLAWEELSPMLKPDHFTVENLRARLSHLGTDPWASIGEINQTLPTAARRSARRTRKPAATE